MLQCGDRVRIRQVTAGERVRETFVEGTVTQMAERGWCVVLVDGTGSAIFRDGELEPVALTADEREADAPASIWQKGDLVRNTRSGERGLVIAADLATVTVKTDNPVGWRLWRNEHVKAQ